MTRPIRDLDVPLSALEVDVWNALHPVGTPVLAYPNTRQDPPLKTRTRTPAWELGHGLPVVSVDGYAGGICLTHIDPLPDTHPLEAP